ncbi:MAG: hypothetical protein ACI8TQ_003829 [Planctomycetota bacterium]|jgi:hypothetical protein
MRKISTRSRTFTFAACALAATAGFAQADFGDQLAKLSANDGTLFDLFGNSVAISGTTAVIGAQYDDDNGFNSGSAYLFDMSTGLQIAKLLADDGDDIDFFGFSVAISGPIAIVGAYGAEENGCDSGAAYLFDTSTGAQLAKLLPDDGFPFDNFGISVGISGTTAIVGATSADPLGANSGAAYLFDTTTGMQIAKLVPNDGAAGDGFGSVAINGTVAVIGARLDDDLGPNSGSAYVFDVLTGVQTVKLLPSDGAAGDQFGVSASISGSTVVLGSRLNNDFGSDSGSAYLFNTSNGLQIAKLLPNDGAAGDRFGLPVGISGTTVVVGARQDDDLGTDSGSAYLFDAVTGLQTAKLLPDDGIPNGNFGVTVAVSGPNVLVGARQDDENGSASGAAYLYEGSPQLALVCDVTSIPLSKGGMQLLSLDGGVSRADWHYWMFGSATGATPGLDFGNGVVLPLNWDGYMRLTLQNPNLNIFSNFIGQLDSMGRATAMLKLPPGSAPSLAGISLNHAYLASPSIAGADFASNAEAIMLIP